MRNSVELTMREVVSLSVDVQWYDNIWLWISIVEIVVIFILVVYMKNRSSKTVGRDSKTQVLSSDVDFGNIVRSSFYAAELYKKLIVLCHPDRFLDPILNREANLISQEIMQNRTNLKRLEELKIKAIELLNVKL
ncbi:MAG: hypothetical protein R3Y61_01080 [Rikenellaceae bacterium]